MPTRTSRTAWNGGLQDGAGQVELTSSGRATFDVSFPKRAADDADGTTSPEELIAAAHSSCYAMQLSALIAEAGGTPQSLDVTADVSLGPDPNGGFRLTGIKLTVRGEVDVVVNTPSGRTARADGLEIRTATVAADKPLFTTIATLGAAVASLESSDEPVSVTSLQEDDAARARR